MVHVRWLSSKLLCVWPWDGAATPQSCVFPACGADRGGQALSGAMLLFAGPSQVQTHFLPSSSLEPFARLNSGGSEVRSVSLFTQNKGGGRAENKMEPRRGCALCVQPSRRAACSHPALQLSPSRRLVPGEGAALGLVWVNPVHAGLTAPTCDRHFCGLGAMATATCCPQGSSTECALTC